LANACFAQTIAIDTREDGILQKFQDSVLILLDDGMHFSLEDVLQTDSSKFLRKKDMLASKQNRQIWINLHLVNKSSKILKEHLLVCGQADTVFAYFIDNEVVVDTVLTGADIAMTEKAVPVQEHSIPFHLKPNDTLHVLLRSTFSDRVATEHYFHVFTRNSERFTHQILHKYSRQSFFAGITFLFSLLGFFMFLTFKDRSFLEFGLLMAFFGLYFLYSSGLFTSYVYVFDDSLPLTFLTFVVSGIVISMFFFVKDYVNLQNTKPKYYKFYVILSLYIAAFSPIGRLIHSDFLLVARINNIQLLLWIVATLIPLVQLTRQKNKAARVLLISVGILGIGGLIFILAMLNVLPRNSFTSSSLQMGTIALSALLFYGLLDRINQIQKAKLWAQAEQEKSDELLFNILPFEIAQELKENGAAVAKKFNDTSILFTDFKGFTQISELLSPEELVAEINTCFMAFDSICEKYEIEKIKTIGDAFMAAGGLPNPRPGSTKRVVLAALEMNDFILKRAKVLKGNNQMSFEMRIGIHTGPVIAGVVGIKKYQYDIWGDTVNTAARMESSGAPGKINISESTYALVKDDPDFIFEARGKIEAKGKGEIEMYFVNRSQT
jgi:class 3 adenylate cyclase